MTTYAQPTCIPLFWQTIVSMRSCGTFVSGHMRHNVTELNLDDYDDYVIVRLHICDIQYIFMAFINST